MSFSVNYLLDSTLFKYMDIPQEELRGSQSLNLDWPFQGTIEFQNVMMRYMPSLPPALRGISFTVPGGMKVSAHIVILRLVLTIAQHAYDFVFELKFSNVRFSCYVVKLNRLELLGEQVLANLVF